MSRPLLTIDECFSSSHTPDIKSARIRVRVKTPGDSIRELKEAIAHKRYPRLSDPSCITLIIPEGGGRLLLDHTLASTIPMGSYILALGSPTSYETTRLHSSNGVWKRFNLHWNVNLLQFIEYYVEMGFCHGLVVEAHRHEVSRCDLIAYDVNPHFHGYLAPQVMLRLRDAEGLHKVASQDCSQNSCAYKVVPYSASGFSVDSRSSNSTIHDVPHGLPSPAVPTPGPSGVMASPSEHESAYDEAYHQHMNELATTTTRARSESGTISTVRRYRSHMSTASSTVDDVLEQQEMDWHSCTTTPISTFNQVADLITTVRNLTQERDQMLRECERMKEIQSSSSNRQANQPIHFSKEMLLLTHQLQNLNSIKFNEEILLLTNQLHFLKQENSALKEGFRVEYETVAALLESFSDLEAVNQSIQTEVRANVQSIQENLTGVVTCPICFERYGSLSANADKRPIHLSCGHIFCASCLDTDWSLRFNAGNVNPYRCFNRCTDVVPGSLGEVYLLDEVKGILDRLAAY